MNILRFVETQIVFKEIPDQITLAINISNCPCHCVGCHSPHLSENIGVILNTVTLDTLIAANKGITCIAFMGGDACPKEINRLAKYVRDNTDLLVAWYSGKEELSPDIELKNFNFIKLGPYKEECGPLDDKNTNQRMYSVEALREYDANTGEQLYGLNDITDLFWK